MNNLDPLRSSSVVGIGLDLVEVDRVAAALGRRPSLAERLFTLTERQYCLAGARPHPRFAARFAAKEAAMKAMGVGIGGVGWHDIEVVRTPHGEPILDLSNRALEAAQARGAKRWLVSMTHTRVAAQAVVVLVG